MYDDRIYYQDQTTWSTTEFYALWRYLNRLLQYIGPTPSAVARPESHSARIQARRSGKRDEELAALDLSRMSAETRYLLKHMLIQTDRYDLALTRFANLTALGEVGELGHVLFLDEPPTLVHEYLTSVGIYL